MVVPAPEVIPIVGRMLLLLQSILDRNHPTLTSIITKPRSQILDALASRRRNLPGLQGVASYHLIETYDSES